MLGVNLQRCRGDFGSNAFFLPFGSAFQAGLNSTCVYHNGHGKILGVHLPAVAKTVLTTLLL